MAWPFIPMVNEVIDHLHFLIPKMQNGKNLLHIAAENGSVGILLWLLRTELGKLVNEPDDVSPFPLQRSTVIKEEEATVLTCRMVGLL